MNTFVIEYIWLDADNKFRSKIRVLSIDERIDTPWNYDGSSTNQATTKSSEIILKVVATFNHPFMNGKLNVSHIKLNCSLVGKFLPNSQLLTHPVNPPVLLGNKSAIFD